MERVYHASDQNVSFFPLNLERETVLARPFSGNHLVGFRKPFD